MKVPEGLHYSREHEWVRVDGDTAVIGITDYAQDALGDLVYVQLPEIGVTVKAAEVCCEIESTKSVSEIYAPVSGTVVEVNEALIDVPEQVNTDPYGEGWIFKLTVSDPAEIGALLDASSYSALTEEASDQP